MPTIEFDESMLQDKDALIQALLEQDANDPRSVFYKRVLVRPKINWLKAAAGLLLPLLGAVGLYFLLTRLGLSPLWSGVSAGCALALYALCTARRGLIFCVKLYQRFAPAAIRNKCRFEPSCSQYMIACLEKYGLWKGLKKGIDRLRRCNTAHGGFDEP